MKNIKFYIPFIYAIFVLLPVQAKKVEIAQAEKLAQNFLQSKHKLQAKSDILGYFATSVLDPNSSDFNSNQLITTDINPVSGWLKDLKVSAGTLSPAFSPDVFDYTLQVDASVETIDITGITDISGATVTGNVTALPLKLNDYTDVAIKVTLPGGDSQTYNVFVIRGNIPNASYTIKVDDNNKTISNFIGVTPGDTLYIDWGDGTAPDEITVNNGIYTISNFPEYFIYGNWMYHTYSTSGEYKVSFYGEDEQTCPLLTLWQNARGCLKMNFDEGVHINQIDMRKASQLRVLFVEEGDIPNLDVSHNKDLEDLYCDSIKLSKLDVTNNRKLLKLECSNNHLTNLDVSNNTALKRLFCGHNQLTNLDVVNNTLLWGLDCSRNLLTELDVSKNAALCDIDCDGNQLTKLDVSHNLALIVFYCNQNQLTNLDVSNNQSLAYFWCGNNQLTNLDVSNNSLLSELACGDYLTNLDVSHNPLLSLLAVNGQLTDLDVSHNPLLTYLSCAGSKLTKLDVSKNTALTELYCHNNQLTNLDVSQNTALEWLFCGNNQLTNLDVNHNPELKNLYCIYNFIPLANLYELSQKISDPNNKWLGWQTLPDTTVKLNTSIPIDTVFHGVNTVFDVNAPYANYKLNNGEITFLASGDYQVNISNPAIISPNIPAVVSQTFHVTDNTGISNIPQIKNLNAWVQDGTLHVSGLTAGKTWSVCNTAGAIVYQGVAMGDVETLRATPLPHAAYIIQSGKETVKIVL